MSDDEENQSLLDEIEALDNILLQKSNASDVSISTSTVCTSKEQFPSTSKVSQQSGTKQQTSFENEYNQDLSNDLEEQFVVNNSYTNYSCNDLQDLLELNKKLMESVIIFRDKAVCLLDKCVEKQELIKEQISKMGIKTSKMINVNAGMPYFKDRNYYTPKRNEDTETKVRNNELRLTTLQRIHRWHHTDKNRLLKVIRHEVTLTVLKKTEDEIDIESAITKTSQLPDDVKEAIGSLGTMKFDWMKIANSMPENKHTAEECEVMWNVFLHPNINKQRWTSKEDKHLNSIVEKYQCENWDAIAKDLKTNRSGYQCFIRYNTNNWKNLMKGQTWSETDDSNLMHLVDKLKIGDYIPWGYIASCMCNYTKQQVYFRWNYSLAPHLKKGRFSEVESQQLLQSVRLYGPNFSKISALLMTNRTNIQLKEHYGLLLARQKSKKIWTLEEDEKLIVLKNKYGQNWVKIVKELPGVTRVQARLRYFTLLRYEKRGVPIPKIDRTKYIRDPEHTVMTFMNSPWSRENKEIFVKHLKIDDQLINFFKKEGLKNSDVWRKTYNPLKLQEDTKTLLDNLTTLNANIDITNNFEDNFDLSEKHQQLFNSLQDYVNEEQYNTFSDKIKQITLKMCGSVEPALDQQRFIPPLPFGFCPPKSKIRKSNSIDYIKRPNDHTKIQLDMVLEPNKLVTDYLGEDTDYQFEKIKRLFMTNTEAQKKVYNLKCKQFANTDLFSNSDYNAIGMPACNTKKPKYDWELNRMMPSDSSIDSQPNSEIRPLSYIQPNRAMLQGYQEILLNSASYQSSSDEPEFQHKLTHAGREALYMFKKRFEQIFHIPSGLSKIIPPDIVDESAFLPAVEKTKIKKKLKNKRLNPSVEK